MEEGKRGGSDRMEGGRSSASGTGTVRTGRLELSMAGVGGGAGEGTVYVKPGTRRVIIFCPCVLKTFEYE